MTTAATPVIALEGIVKRYPVGDGWFTALDDITCASKRTSTWPSSARPARASRR